LYKSDLKNISKQKIVNYFAANIDELQHARNTTYVFGLILKILFDCLGNA